MPKEYIEREATLEVLRNLGNRDYRREKGTIADAIKMIMHPAYTPAADVVEVVYCKECKHLYCCSAVDREFYCRHIHGMKGALNPIEENPYCSYGERKDGKE